MRKHTRASDPSLCSTKFTLLLRWSPVHQRDSEAKQEPSLFDYKLVTRAAKLSSFRDRHTSFPFATGTHLFLSQHLHILLDASTHLYKRVCPSVRPHLRIGVTKLVLSRQAHIFFFHNTRTSFSFETSTHLFLSQQALIFSFTTGTHLFLCDRQPSFPFTIGNRLCLSRHTHISSSVFLFGRYSRNQ